MQSELGNVALLRVIENIDCNTERQQDVDNCYESLTKEIIAEMDKQILVPETQNGKRKLKQGKLFWNEDLSNLWKKMCSDEKVMTSCTNRRVRKVLRENLNDRSFRRAERSYKEGKMIELEEVCINDPRKFYELLKCLGPQKTNPKIPLEVVEENGNVVYERESPEKMERRF